MNKIKSGIYTFLTFTVIIIIWYFASLNALPLFVPSPLKVWDDLLQMISTKVLFIHLYYTFRRIFVASCLSGIVALPLGLLVHNSKIAKATIHPVVNLLRYIPVTAFYPLLIMWAGIDEKMKISFYFVATFVYMMPSVVLALEEINEDLIDTGLTIGMSKYQVITMIQLPAVLPSILNSFVMMFGIGWTYCAVVESINAKFGIGYVVQQSSSRGRTDMVFMAIIVIMVVSFLFDNISKAIIRKVFKWRYLKEND